MPTSKDALQPARTQGALMGFGNLYRKESDEWWRTRTWLVHSVIWLLLINGIVLAVLNTPFDENAGGPPPSGTMMFVIMGGLMTGLGVILVMQGAMLDEKKSGTAAWVLSKPLSRSAFLLAKLAANSLAVLLIMIVLQGAVAFVLVSIFEAAPPILPFLAGLGLLALHLMFYLSLTLMLSTIFNERGAVLGIPIGLLFGAQFLMGFAPALAQVMPWLIILPSGSQGAGLAHMVMAEQPLPTAAPIVATALWVVVFVGVSLWRFEREEF